jgi:2-polyprenyl-3-methyl-5-hydroxy-6-metoxy-1,4-benzoquinol methylase
MKCNICKNKNIKMLNYFGEVPRSHDFKKKNITKKYKFVLNKCSKCSVIQLKKTGNNQSFIPKLKGIRNNEPDEHLNGLILYLEKKLKEKKKILLISSFDRKIYESLKNKNFKNLKLLDSKKHLKILKKNPNQFLIQNSILKKEYIKKIRNLGKFDIIVSCRVLEHTYNLNSFIKNLEIFLKPNGNFVFEIPDSQKSLTQGDVSMLWEEHPIYFTKKSFFRAFQILGYKVLSCKKYIYPQEDALVLRVKKYGKEKIIIKKITKTERKLGTLFVKKFINKKKKLITFLKNQIHKNKKIAIFGAGHRSIVYFHTNKLTPYINYIFDDNKNKKNLIFPGTNLKIKPSLAIMNNKIDICFLSLNITKEKKIIDKLRKLNNKIKFYSISPDSKYAF